jgi:PAS domain S-box-containing protein
MNSTNGIDFRNLRIKAEEIHKKRNSEKVRSVPTEEQLLGLFHEFEVYQIELVLQNEELKLVGDRSENLYRLVSENINDIVTLHDLDFKTLYVSPSLEKVTGYKPEKFIGKNFLKLLKYKPYNDFDFTAYLRFIIPIKHAVSGKEIKLEILWKAIQNEQGELKSYLATSRDVTERESILEELRGTLEKKIELNQLKTKFISMISHELRTPLATIQSSADLIEIIAEKVNDEKTHERLLKQIRKIYVQLSRLSNIISDLMLIEKNKDGELDNIEIDVDIKSQLIQLVFNRFGLEDNMTKIKLDLGSEPLVLKSDPTLLMYVFGNLIENAIKYTLEGSPKPILKIIRNPESAEIHVIDFGIGIPQGETKFVLDTCYRATNVKNIKGSGLGLSIATDLLAKLGGKLTFNSEENQGSTFIVTIPYEKKNLIN